MLLPEIRIMKERIEKSRNLEIQPSQIGLFVFDWSGVISDDKKPVYEAGMRILEANGKARLSFEEWLSKTKITLVEFMAEHGIYGDPEELFAFYERQYDEVVRSGIPPTVYSKAREVLVSLCENGKRLAVLSGHPTGCLLREVREYSLEKFFDHVSGSCMDKAEGLREICRLLEEPPASTIYICDSIGDVQAAREARCYSAAICAGYHSREQLLTEKPEKLFEDLSNLQNWFMGNL